MALFENFPYTNVHELNLDWLIEYMKQIEAEVQDGPVVSVNGQTGVVTLYQEAQVQLPDITDSQQTYWNIFRYLNGHIYGIRFDSNGNVYAIRDGIRTKLLTWADIPADAGVISVNGLYGVVHISGTDIPWMGGENETVFDKLSANEDAIDELTITLGTLSNAIKAGIAYLEPNVDDTAIHNIPAGRYVFWKNYAYKSTQAISIGDTLSSTNLQTVGEGGFINDLQTQLNTLNSNIELTGSSIMTVSLSGASVANASRARKNINSVYICISLTSVAITTKSGAIGTLASGIRPSSTTVCDVYDLTNDKMLGYVIIATNGDITFYQNTPTNISSNDFRIVGSYIV